MSALLPSALQALPALRHRVQQEVTEALKLLDDPAWSPGLAGELQAQYVRSLHSIPALVDLSVTAQQLTWRLRPREDERAWRS